MTWDQCAAELNTSKKTLFLFRKKVGAPQEPDPELWRPWISQTGSLKGNSRDLAALKVLIAEEELIKKKRENEVAAGRVIERKTIEDFLMDWSARLDSLLTSEYETNAPPQLVGKGIAEIRERLRLGHDRIREATNRGLLTWKPEGDNADQVS